MILKRTDLDGFCNSCFRGFEDISEDIPEELDIDWDRITKEELDALIEQGRKDTQRQVKELKEKLKTYKRNS